MNASAATGVAPSVFAGMVDSVWIDFTKGLGAPIGAVLAGTSQFIAAARRQKHVFGGAMRQAGIAAAGCLHALDHHVARLVEDHSNARRLAQGLAVIPGVAVQAPETNMVFFEVTGTGMSNGEFLEGMLQAGVRMGPVRGKIRAVTHLDVSRDDVEFAIRAAVGVTTAGRHSGPDRVTARRAAGY